MIGDSRAEPVKKAWAAWREQRREMRGEPWASLSTLRTPGFTRSNLPCRRRTHTSSTPGSRLTRTSGAPGGRTDVRTVDDGIADGPPTAVSGGATDGGSPPTP